MRKRCCRFASHFPSPPRRWGGIRLGKSRLPVPLAATMVFLRTSLVWLLSAWVASGPSALILHHQLAHAGGSSACCADASSAAAVAPRESCCATPRKPLCRLSERDRSGDQASGPSRASQKHEHAGQVRSDQLQPGQGQPTGEDSSPAGPCHVCELLLHHHAMAADVCAFVVSDTPLPLGSESDDSSPFQRRLRNWNLRGPPSC